MRKIMFIAADQDYPDEDLLRCCALHSSAVEPVQQGVFLDLSMHRYIGEIVRIMARSMQQPLPRKLRAGLATSKLLARIAGEISPFQLQQLQPESFRCIPSPEINLVQVLPGKEAAFLQDLPLGFFPGLEKKERQQLKRLGFSCVGEIATLSAHQLSSMLNKDAADIFYYIQGRDSGPVLGLYPPAQIVYPFSPRGSIENRFILEECLDRAAPQLISILEQRHQGFGRINLQLADADRCWTGERILTAPCQERKQLQYFLKNLLQQAPLNQVSYLQITLAELTPLQLVQSNLFLLPGINKEEQQKQQLQKILDRLEIRFPGKVQLGMAPDRREQVLSMWDPWRFSRMRPG